MSEGICHPDWLAQWEIPGLCIDISSFFQLSFFRNHSLPTGGASGDSAGLTLASCWRGDGDEKWLLAQVQCSFCEAVSLTSQLLQHFPNASSRTLKKKIILRKTKHDCFSFSLSTSPLLRFVTLNPFFIGSGGTLFGTLGSWVLTPLSRIQSLDDRSRSLCFEMHCLDFG